jgi:pimeloyl-ACP methyl ester carboxylesterase
MTEFPVFVPHGDEHIAAVITVPGSHPRALVHLLQGGGGQSRSHRNRTWVRLARGLADKGIASVRMDYPGLGDSTGFPSFEVESPPVEAALAVVRVSLGAVGVDTFAVVGNCIGIPTAIEMATRIPCATVVCVVPTSLHQLMQMSEARHAGGARRAMGKRLPTLRRVVRDLRRRGIGRSRSATRLRPELATILRSTSVMILHGGTDDSWKRLGREVEELRREIGDEAGVRLVTGALPSEGPGFRELRFQQAMVDASVDWLDRSLPAVDEAAVHDGGPRPSTATR